MLDFIVGCKVNEQSGEQLIGKDERKIFGFLLGFLHSIAWICNRVKRGIWVPPQHLGIGPLTSSGGC